MRLFEESMLFIYNSLRSRVEVFNELVRFNWNFCSEFIF